MTLYADELVKNIRPLLDKNNTIEDFLPKSVRTRPALVRYFSQYIIYQFAASRIKADIHHIIDHSYAHLLHSLSADRTVITFHDAIGIEKAEGFGRGTIRNRNLSALKKAGALIFDSRASRNALLQRIAYPEDKAFLIYPGLDPVFFETPQQNSFEVLGIKPGRYLLHVGHTGAYKNIPTVLRVLSEVRKKGIDIKLLKTGMPFTDVQKELADNLKISQHITHLGLVRKEMLPHVYRAACCLVFPSYNEGFGFPVLEAMASGLPVISSNRGSLPELAARKDTLFAPDDVYGMMRRVQEILEDESLREAMIKEGKLKAREFKWENTSKQILDVYRRLCT